MLKQIGTGLIAAGLLGLSAVPGLAKGHTEAVASACMERSAFSDAECACIGMKAADLDASEVAYLLSIGDGEMNSASVAIENETGVLGVARVHAYLNTALPICAMTE